MKKIEFPKIPDGVEMVEIPDDPNWYCKECKGKEHCNQPRPGFYEWQGNIVRCSYNLRGFYNSDLILKDKYKEFNCDNLEEMKELINKFHNLYLWGEQGLGKTHWLYWLANKYNLMGANVFIAKWSEINQLIKDEPKAEMRDTISIRLRLKDVEMLFIDDLGNETMTPESAEILSTVIDHRYLNGLPTFITSNYSINELGKHYLETKHYGQSAMPFNMAKQLTSRLDDKNSGVIKIKNRNWRKR